MPDVLIYNPRNGSPIGNAEGSFPWANAKWEGLMKNSIRRYPEHVAEELLKRYGFLVKVKPEDLPRIKEDMVKEYVSCDFCNWEGTPQQLEGHVKAKHRLDDKTQKILDEVPMAKSEYVRAKQVRLVPLTPEQMEGIPDTSDLNQQQSRDGWYGPGLETEFPASYKAIKPGTPGNFGA